MPKSDVAVPASSVPALAETPATSLGLGDISLPTLYIAQRTSGACEYGVNYGDLFVANGASDTSPQVVLDFANQGEGLLFVPLHMRKSWTHSDGDNLTTFPYDASGQPPVDAPEGTFLTYTYTVLVPEFDTELPVTFRLNSKSQRPAANAVNMTVLRSGRPWYVSAFRVTTTKEERGQLKWAVPHVVATPNPIDEAQLVLALESVLPGLAATAAREDGLSERAEHLMPEYTIAEGAFINAVAKTLKTQDEIRVLYERLREEGDQAARANVAALDDCFDETSTFPEVVTAQEEWCREAADRAGLPPDNPVVAAAFAQFDEARERYVAQQNGSGEL